jgi:hypothetical protein
VRYYRKTFGKKKMSKTATILVALFTAIDCNSALAAEPEANHSALTTFILESLPARTGLCVHVGVGDGFLTADLLQGGKFLVHGLDPDAKAVEAVNRMLLGKGVYGQASVEQCDLSTLPYAENVVNLMVVAEADGLNMAEVMRVLAPHGIVMVKGADTSALEGVGFEAVKNAAGWARGRKPRPADMDEWRQYGHDAGLTDLSRDKLVGPPEQLRWLNGPVRGREQTPPGHGVVTAGGRLFYSWDIAEPQVEGPMRFELHARDAYNGLLLWKRTVETLPTTMMKFS